MKYVFFFFRICPKSFNNMSNWRFFILVEVQESIKHIIYLMYLSNTYGNIPNQIFVYYERRICYSEHAIFFFLPQTIKFLDAADVLYMFHERNYYLNLVIFILTTYPRTNNEPKKLSLSASTHLRNSGMMGA